MLGGCAVEHNDLLLLASSTLGHCVDAFGSRHFLRCVCHTIKKIVSKSRTLLPPL
jgi:hypothetical protein